MQYCYGRHNFSRKICNSTSGLSMLLHGVISLPDAITYDKQGNSLIENNTVKDIILLLYLHRKVTTSFFADREICPY